MAVTPSQDVVIRLATDRVMTELTRIASDPQQALALLGNEMHALAAGARTGTVTVSYGEASGVRPFGTITPNSTLAENDTVTIAGTALTWKNGYAIGTITCSSVDEDDGFDIGDTSFVFKTAGDPEVEEEITIGGSNALTATAAAAAINAHSVASTVVVATAASDVVHLRAVTTGTDGNAIVLTSTDGTDLAVSGSGALAGGDAISATQIAIDYGSTAATVSTTACATNLAAKINAQAGLAAILEASASGSAVTVTANEKGDIGNQITVAESGSGVDLTNITSGKLTAGVDPVFVTFTR